ncbi:MAG: hypothetical protein KGQ46_12040 [Hyphomicrobiales bacterium]|nr:hypothetical protein [Hyphomicrobiales bacterium]MDE2114914.1 hypothetical protein [Hyphomicrobiales bacterium]
MKHDDVDTGDHKFFRYSIIVAAGIFSLTGMAGVSVLSQIADSGMYPVLAWTRTGQPTRVTEAANPGARNNFGKVDYGATGSIRSVLDKPVTFAPCSGEVKNQDDAQ